MPEEAQVPTEDVAPEASEETSTKSSFLKKIVVMAFVTFVVAVECMLAYMYLPSAEDTAAMAEGTMTPGTDADVLLQRLEQLEDGDLTDQAEVDLGQFTVTASQPMSNTSLRIDFQLWGTVDEETYDEFSDLLEEKRHRFREQVIVTVRGADVDDYTDPQLGLIKRTVLQKTNRLFGGNYLRTVILDDFSFIEQ